MNAEGCVARFGEGGRQWYIAVLLATSLSTDFGN